MTLSFEDFNFLGVCLEGFFFGLYSGIFAMYLQRHRSNKSAEKANKIIFYALCVLYVLSLATLVFDTTESVTAIFFRIPLTIAYRFNIVSTTLIACCDFISQSILIYRCWIVWGSKPLVVIVPSFLAVTFLATWLAINGSTYIFSGQLVSTLWGYTLNLTSLTASMTVNALVMGLIVFKILKVFRTVKVTSYDSGRKLRSIIFILIESGTALFSIQLARLVLTIRMTDTAIMALQFVAGTHEMLNGITPTIILVRVSMGLSFHDDQSMEEAIGSLRFAGHPISIPETESFSSVCQETSDNDQVDVRLSDGFDEIQMLER